MEIEDKSWQDAFTQLNLKLGNNVWGAWIEGDGFKGKRIRIFVNDEKYIPLVQNETSGVLDGLPIVFEVYKQEDYALKINSYENKTTT